MCDEYYITIYILVNFNILKRQGLQTFFQH